MALFRAPISSTAFRDFRRPLTVCSISSTSPRRSLNRKNHLREKLLRTLTLPHPDSLVPKSPHNKNPVVEIDYSNEDFDSMAVEGSIGISDGNGGNNIDVPEVSVFRVGLWLVGAFVFQTVVAVVWMLGLPDLDDEKNGEMCRQKDENGGLDIDFREKDVSKVFEYPGPGGGVGLQDKIEEIRMMAREVREIEKSERTKKISVVNDDIEDNEDEDGFGRSGIEKEVRDRLIKLHNRLENGHGKPLSIALDDKHEVENVDPEGVTKDSGSEDHTDDEVIGDNGVDSMSQVQKLGFEGADTIDLTMRLEDVSKRERAKTSGKTKLKKRRGQGGTLGKKAGFGKAEPKSLKQDMVETRHEAGNMNGLWWLSLPYVFVIYMSRDGEGLRGLFTLGNGADAFDDVSYSVAFEGRDDANNFCYILETTFGNLEDFSAEVVPISIKELGGVVDSDYSRVIVVKKGQLKLYAGQPLQDVEMALRSLVEQT